MSRWLLALVLLSTAACARACSDEDELTMSHEVEVLVGEPGAAADAAERRLVSRGSIAIPYLETGLYSAAPSARRRVIEALLEIGDRAADPILVYLARRDPDPEVRRIAAGAHAELSVRSDP